jgi:hypothetical protein
MRTTIVNGNAVPIVAHTPVKGRMNQQFSGHPQWLSCFL